ncbi:hypothetical protein BVY00_01055 [bacterium G20]|nr:hypothetical protein BVY00_01055 [bacterium G20]
MSEGLPIIEACYRLYKQFYALQAKMAKERRYSIGVSTEATILNLIEQLCLAQTAPKLHKRAYLQRASAQLDILRLKLRLCLELKVANETRLFQYQAICSDIGRMLGGWLKSIQ